MAPRFLGWVLTCGLFLLSIPLPVRVGAGLAPALGDRKGSPLPFSYAPSDAFSAAPFGPFSEIWPVLVLILLVLAALGIGISRWRIASIQRRNRQLALEVAERTLTIAMQTADLEALYQADEELERHVQLDQVLQALVDIAVDRLHADKSAVLAWDDGRERMAIRVARNFSPQAVGQITFAPGEGFVGQVMATGESITVADAEAELRPEEMQDRRIVERAEVVEAVLGEGIRSFMHIPIRLATEGSAQPPDGSTPHGEAFGVFCVCYDVPRAFGGREQRLFTALAQRAALAVQNAQHFAEEQRRAEQFRVIGEVGRGLASILDIDELLNEIVRLIQQAFGYDHVGLALIEAASAAGDAAADAAAEPGAKRSTGWARASCGMTRTSRLRPTVSRWVRKGSRAGWPGAASRCWRRM